MSKEQDKPKSAPRTGSRTVERRQERERQRLRQRRVTYGVVIIALIALVVIVFLIVKAPADAPIPAGALTRYQGITQSVTKEGYPRLGDSTAPVQVAEYAGFGCVKCHDFNVSSMDQMVSLVKTGKVAFTFIPLYNYGDIANDQGAAASAICAGEQKQFWPFHDALFDWQAEFGNQAFTNNRIASGVAAFNLDQGTYSGCITGSDPGDVLATAKAQGQSLSNFSGAPTFTINGVVPLGDDQKPLTNTADIFARINTEIERASVIPTAEVTAQATSESTAEATGTATAEATSEAAGAATQEATPSVAAPTAEATVAATAEATPAATPAK